MDVEHRNFILRHEEAIKELIDLNTLVPKLYNKGLLTKDEREDLLDFNILRTHRKIKLVTTLSNKGKDAPRLLIECLREEKTHLPHAELAEILEHNLHASPRQNGGGSVQHPSQMVLPSNTGGATAAPTMPVLDRNFHDMLTHSSGSSSHEGARVDCPEYVSDYAMSNSRLQGDSIAPPPAHVAPIVGPSNPQLSTTHGHAVADSLEQLQERSPEYANLILCLSAELSSRGYTFEDISRTLQELFESDAIQINLPSNVHDFPTLCLHLRQLNVCHEADVDLLCELLHTMQLEDLKRKVKAYADRVSSIDVMQHRFQQATGSVTL